MQKLQTLKDRINKSGALIIMNERAGRAVVKEKGVSVIGTAAIIGLAKKKD